MTDTKNTNMLPEGFVSVRSRLDGFYQVAIGNAIEGTLLDSFESDSDYGRRKVYKIKITNAKPLVAKTGKWVATPTVVADDNGKRNAEVGEVIGVDEKGWLKGLAEIESGSTVYVCCTGQGEAKAGRSAPWVFSIGKVPL
jgi:hypothetical protein